MYIKISQGIPNMSKKNNSFVDLAIKELGNIFLPLQDLFDEKNEIDPHRVSGCYHENGTREVHCCR